MNGRILLQSCVLNEAWMHEYGKEKQNILRAKNSRTFESLIRKLSNLQTITIPFVKYQIENFHTKYFPTQLQVFLTHTHLPLLTTPISFPVFPKT